MENMNKTQKNILYGIFVIAIILRLWGITHELNDYHHFRQTYTAAFAKYFYEYSMNLFFPNLDILNYKNISEFQLYPYLVAILYKIFGFHDIIGRVVALLFSLCNFWLLFLIVKRYYDSIAGLFAAFLFAVLPLSVFYSRVFMLESMMLFLSLSSVYFAGRWIDSGKTKLMLLAALFSALTLLIKIPTVYILFPIAFLIFHKDKWGAFKVINNYLYLLLSFLPALYWYFLHAKLFPANSIVDQRMAGAYYSKDAWDYYLTLMRYGNTWKQIFLVSIAEYHMAIAGFLFFLGGVYLKFKALFQKDPNKKPVAYSSDSWLFFFWMIGFIFFILGFIAPNLAHEYYQLPIELPLIAMAAFFLRNVYALYEKQEKSIFEKIGVGFAAILLIAIVPFSINKLKSRLEQDFFYNKFAEELQKVSKKEDLIIAIDNTPRTEVFYFADRRGYQLIMPGAFQIILGPNDKEKYINEIESYRKEGAKFFVSPYVELAGFIPWLKEYLDANYKCHLGCEITKQDVLNKDPKIKGYIYELTSP
ncbi:MAG: glycosyltransferase family 39 protein [Leptospiraceae bacterium]|nr:glycosyltransferase family 39 protein [Leptospiraceae bacterium]